MKRKSDTCYYKLVAKLYEALTNHRTDICKYLSDRSLTDSTVKFLREAKVFVATIKLCNDKLVRHCHDEIHRQSAYKDAVSELINIRQKARMPFILVKTNLPFGYDKTDIDIFVIDKSRIASIVSVLCNIYGFKIVTIGTSAIVLRKIVNKTVVDIDLQWKLSAGTFEYVNTSKLIQRLKNRIQDENGVINTILILGHTYLKDLSISLGRLFYLLTIIASLTNDDLKDLALSSIEAAFDIVILIGLIQIIEFIMLMKPYLTSIRTRRITFLALRNAYVLLKLFNSSSIKSSSNLLLDTIWKAIRKSMIKTEVKMKGKIKVPLYASMFLYFAIIKKNIIIYKRLGKIIELLKIPSSKGLGQLLGSLFDR